MRRTLLMIAAVALLLTQCRKPVVEYPTAEPTNENMVSMTVTVGHGRTLIGADGTITWSTGDKLYVGDGEKYIGFLTLVGDGGSATGTFSGSVSTTSSTTFGLYYLGSNPPAVADNATSVDISFASQTGLIGDLDDCHIGYGTATGRVDGTSVILESTDPVTMTSKVALAYFEFKDGTAEGYTGAITLSGTNICNEMTVKFSGAESDMFTGKTVGGISLASTPESSKKYVMLVPPATVGEETLNFGNDDMIGSTKFYKGIEANKFYCLGEGEPIAVTVKPIEFTVGMDGDTPRKVKFSPGNLQYLGKKDGSGTWRFAEHQWDYMGDGPKTTTGKKGNVDLGADYEGKYNTGSGIAGGSETNADKEAARDLFGWGATGYQDTRTSSTGYQRNYRPYSTNKTAATSGTDAYNKNCYGYGPDFVSSPYYNLEVKNMSDWGCLKIGDDPANTWRTLTSAEWEYLLNTRSGQFAPEIGGSTDCRYAAVKVNDVCGMMVFPDEFAWPSGVSSLPSTFNTYSSNWNGVDYDTEEFGKLESLGVVFLPAAGDRDGMILQNVGSVGFYWSSSGFSTSAYAYGLRFDDGRVSPQGAYLARYFGRSVRMVR